MLKKVNLDQLGRASGGQSSFDRYGGYEAWSRSKRADHFRDFQRLRAEGKVQYGRNGEWGRQYHAYMSDLLGGSRHADEVPAAVGSRADNLPKP